MQSQSIPRQALLSRQAVATAQDDLRTEGEVRSLVSAPARSGIENVGEYTRVGAVRVKRRVVFPGEEA